MRSSGRGGVKGPCKAGANEAAGRGVVLVGAGAGCAVVSVIRRDRGEVSGRGHRIRRRWGWCYRRRADKRGYSIREDRCRVSGGAHRTRGRCYRRGT